MNVEDDEIRGRAKGFSGASRVVSLLPSATEIVCALGAEDRLVGRSHECDFPESVTRLPFCTEPKYEPDGTSYQIDERVKAILQEGTSVYRVDASRLDALEPDLVITQDQCEVCAASLSEVEEALCSLVRSRPKILSLSPTRLEHVFGDIRTVGLALGLEGRAGEVISGLEHRIEQVKSKTGRISNRPRVGFIEWLDPPMEAGNWMPELAELAGGVPLFGKAGEHSPWLDWEAFLKADPDVIVILPCGFDLARTRSELPTLTRRPDWDQLGAVRSERVFLADGHQFFNRPGPRIADSLEILAEILHPDRFDFGYRGYAWDPL